MSAVVLALRIYAIYDKSRTVLVIMSLSFFITAIPAIGIIAHVLRVVTGMDCCRTRNNKCDFNYTLLAVNTEPFSPILSIHTCIGANMPKFFSFYWLPILLNEALLFVLCAIRGVQTYRQRQNSIMFSNETLLLILKKTLLFYCA